MSSRYGRNLCTLIWRYGDIKNRPVLYILWRHNVFFFTYILLWYNCRHITSVYEILTCGVTSTHPAPFRACVWHRVATIWTQKVMVGPHVRFWLAWIMKCLWIFAWNLKGYLIYVYVFFIAHLWRVMLLNWMMRPA